MIPVDDLFEVGQVERNIQTEVLYKFLLSDLDNDFSEMAAAYILLILKLEGVIGKKITTKDMQMVESMKKTLFQNKKMHQEMLEQLEKLKRLGQEEA